MASSLLVSPYQRYRSVGAPACPGMTNPPPWHSILRPAVSLHTNAPGVTTHPSVQAPGAAHLRPRAW